MKEKLLTTKNVVLMGMFGALAGVLMLFEFPLPFLAPSFYGLDVSEVPVLIGTFAMGPVAGAIMEVVKILVKLGLKPTSTGSGKGYCGICGYLSGLQARQRSDPQCGKSSESGKEQQTCQRIEHPLLQLI